MEFEWDEKKNFVNHKKHGVSFEEAQYAFFDNKRVVSKDVKHSTKDEDRFFCFGAIDNRILTVRFTIRKNKIRIIGAGYWREGVKKYDEKNSI